MAYKAHFYDKREPYFWAIVANHLAANDPKAAELDRRVFAGLAYKLCEKAAAEVRSEGERVKLPSLENSAAYD